uniref:Arrestin C-terminal-like domain-containing protein n=1 Tax=Panagrolaimus davidi TaxID=227884 RepID=A0A914P1N9_9BILA
MSKLGIILDSKTNVFFPNSEVNGILNLNTNEVHKIKEISVTIIGRAYVYFEELHSDENSIDIFTFKSTHFYINVNTLLWKYNELNQLSNGQHLFPFKFEIPSNAAPNISEKHGDIVYYVKANLEFYGKKRSKVQYYGFSVCAIIDLNLSPELKLPTSVNSTKTIKNCFSRSENSLRVTMSLPTTGFVCGEMIPLKIDICNKTSLKIKSLEYGIGLQCTYTGNTGKSFFYPPSTHIKEQSLTLETNFVKASFMEIKIKKKVF